MDFEYLYSPISLVQYRIVNCTWFGLNYGNTEK